MTDIRALSSADTGPTQAVPRLQIHPRLAGRLGVTQGSMVAVESRRGTPRFEVDLTDGIREDTVFAPFHCGGDQAVTVLTNSAVDPISRRPEFKACALRIRAVQVPSQSVH